jgi:4-amino-4-deoxy-L-arabinose transferase-like glycosyltransferase
MSFVPVAILAACLLALVLRRWSPRSVGVLEAWYVPAIVGVLWAVLPFLVWRGATPMPLDHDEAAYLLQAQIFALGRWAAPAPPFPDMFGQAHVLVTPVLASKYPPGHSLLLALGVLVGAPSLVIFLLNALRVGLVFALARRLSDSTTALLAVVLLYLGNDQARFSSSYYSEVTSGATLVAAWYCLWRWRDSRRLGWLLGVAFALGWCAITRPWSAVAFALPIGFVVLRDVWRGRRWRDLVSAVALGACVVGVLPLWSWGTLGDWRRMPQVEYMQDYMPFDYPHFGVTSAAPRLTPPPDVAAVNIGLLQAEREHTLANVPHDALLRARAMWVGTFPAPSLLFAGMVVLGLVVLPAAGWIAVATLVAAFVAYLAHPTWPQWTVYYFEVVPVLVFLAALGLSALLRVMSGEWAGWRVAARATMPRTTVAGLACCVLLVPALLSMASMARYGLAVATQERREFEAGVARLPHQPVMVFVRYGPKHSPHRSLTVNRADWEHAPAWIVYEMGEESEKLVTFAPARHPYIFDQANGRFLDVGR